MWLTTWVFMTDLAASCWSDPALIYQMIIYLHSFSPFAQFLSAVLAVTLARL